jgi:hypothetical protein
MSHQCLPVFTVTGSSRHCWQLTQSGRGGIKRLFPKQEWARCVSNIGIEHSVGMDQWILFCSVRVWSRREAADICVFSSANEWPVCGIAADPCVILVAMNDPLRAHLDYHVYKNAAWFVAILLPDAAVTSPVCPSWSYCKMERHKLISKCIRDAVCHNKAVLTPSTKKNCKHTPSVGCRIEI